MTNMLSYTGWKKWCPTAEEYDAFEVEGKLPFELIENEYLLIYEDAELTKPINQYCYENGELRRVSYGSIVVPKTKMPVLEEASKDDIKAMKNDGKSIRKSTKKAKKNDTIFPRNIEQVCAIDLLKDNTKTIKLITGSWGTGKAQPIDTIIPTPNGNKKLGDLRVGDFVFDADGQPTKILGVFPQGCQTVYRITLKDGRQTLCAGEHLWTIVDQHKNKFGEHRKITLTTETMFNSKFDRGFGTSTRYKYRLPSCKAVNYSHKYFSVDPYIIGVFLGDGCCTEKALTISSTDDFIVSKIKNLLNAYEVYSSQTNYSHKFYKAAGKLFQTKEVFKDYPEVIGTSWTKRIPEAFFYGDINQRFALLQGLLDTDGCVRLKKYNNSMSISYASVNLDLIKNVQRLCYSLGLTANIIKKERIRKKYYKGKDYCEIYYELAITAPASLRQNLFSLPRKQDITKQSNIVTRGWGTTVAITNIEKLNYKVEMVCIYVDNPDHLYLTNDFIVTHNTMLLVSSAISLLKNGYYDKIIWIRNNIDVKDTKDMGALPGEAIEKLLPYLGPFVDHVGEDEVKCMINNGSLLVEPLQFLRGRNFERAIIMCSEAENLTREHIQLIIARAASESILMFDADTRQRDRSIFDTSKGIERMIESLVGEHLFGYVHLTKSERSETAALADKIK